MGMEKPGITGLLDAGIGGMNNNIHGISGWR